MAKHYGVQVAVCPREAAAAQGCRREGDRVSDAVVVALGAGVNAGAGAGRSGSLVRGGVRSPPPRPQHRRRAGGRRAAAGVAGAAVPGRVPRGSGSSRATRWSSSRQTATASRPATPAPRSRSAPGSASCTWRSTRPPGGGSPATAARSRAPGRRSAPTSTPARSSGRCSRSSRPARRARANRTGRPASRRRRRPPSSAASSPGAWSSIWRATRGSRGWPGDDRLPAPLQPGDRPRAGHPAARRLLGPRRDPGARSTRPGPDCRRPVAITLTPEQARELGFELLAAAEHADRTTTPQPEGDDPR